MEAIGVGVLDTDGVGVQGSPVVGIPLALSLPEFPIFLCYFRNRLSPSLDATTPTTNI